jgi:Dipeptidyl aminopeptidases/acylaminoacyl-peptidases
MKKLIAVAFACLSLTGFAQKHNPERLKAIVNGVYDCKKVNSIRSMADGEHFTQMNGDSTAILRYAYKTGKVVDTLFSVKTARECNFKKFADYEISQDESKVLICCDKEQIYRRSYKANYYVYEVKRNLVSPLSKGGKQQMATFSPNGRLIAFVRDNNLFLVKLDYGTESQITKDGEAGKILYGIPDWLYEEEFEFNRAFAFSPDNGTLAFLRFDETSVPEYTFPMYKGLAPSHDEYATYPGFESMKYPKAGQPNPKVSVQTFNLMSKVIKTMVLKDEEIEYIPRIRFMPYDGQLALFTLNRQQNKLTIYAANPGSGLTKILIREENDKYVDIESFDKTAFLADRIIYVSEKDGFRHLYEYSPTGVFCKQITKGAWEVTDFLGYNGANATYYYQSNEGSPLRTAVYAMDAKGRKTRLTSGEGSNTTTFSADFRYFVNAYSNTQTPTVTTINDASGRTLATVENNAALKAKLNATTLLPKEFFTFKTGKEVSLNGWMIKPANFDAQKRYPVVMVQYSGPGSQNVKDAWVYDWTQHLAQSGYLVVCVDGRGTGGRGAAFRNQTYKHLGLMEAEDQIEAAKYLSTQSFVDKNRLAIWGWSYGGYNTLIALSLGNGIFKAGISIAPNTDWKFYDTAYTERYMQTPGENAEGYELSSPIHYAAQMQGNLLLVQGIADDNVHFQNTAEYAEALVQAGKQFEMQIYTNRNHFLTGGNTRQHLYERFMRFLEMNL